MTNVRIHIHTGHITSCDLLIGTAHDNSPAVTHCRVSSRGPESLGWNLLYAILMEQARRDGRSLPVAEEWTRAVLSSLDSIYGIHPHSINLDDLRFFLSQPAMGGIFLAQNLDPSAIVSLLEARGQRLEDPHSPIDDPDSSFSEEFFLRASDAATRKGWWSQVSREPLSIGSPGAPGRLRQQTPTPESRFEKDIPWTLTGIVPWSSSRVIYIGQDQLLAVDQRANGTQYTIWSFHRMLGVITPFTELIPGPLSWSTINESHELIWLGRDLYVDPTLPDLVLDWVPDTGAYRLYQVDLEGTKSDGETPDILPEPPLTSGIWSTIRTGKQLLYLGKNRVLEWESSSGSYRIWSLNRSVGAGADPLAALTAEGTWASLGEGSQLLNLGGDRVLAWCPANGAYELRRYDRTLAVDPLLAPPLLEGHWQDRGADRALLWLGGKDVLDWRPSDGQYLLRAFARGTAAVDPLPQSSPPPPDDPPTLP